ncbi:hypothetical protein DIS24_g2892 [Lasiodiplodia hormozganensis]|uniref:Uncharacterized protein n=1 Tax=Lasiodiplodia hormozganensis TaxID=869390 RepID=A0AA39Z0K5_9PEZI|nr:hypothetical protein DIS24_g2892 [Lasiodiplodia hormozganensis]
MPPNPTNNKAPDREKELQEQIKVTGEKLASLRKDLQAEQQRKAREEAKKYDDYMKGTDNSDGKMDLTCEIHHILDRFEAGEYQWKQRQKEYAGIIEMLDELKVARPSIVNFNSISIDELDALKKVQAHVKADRMMLNTLAVPLLPSVQEKISKLKDKICGKKPPVDDEKKPLSS